ncbi:uncharacterized protein BDZ83DRAFT_150768 [Colletotrichum acutatum]|uniref:Uncharacterized protein n=1 Tax=Glomerella acutata TaxID=27357 RepID=A0AAD8UQI4_GLOAC|nr:uncharacterized protein BDZ83DRAFT_150768 [Colletotrichum acutatum]KAK1728136.1 hypothetical protein BDZ83DRAFT_150768 [Colletotrichum acutatum]
MTSGKVGNGMLSISFVNPAKRTGRYDPLGRIGRARGCLEPSCHLTFGKSESTSEISSFLFALNHSCSSHVPFARAQTQGHTARPRRPVWAFPVFRLVACTKPLGWQARIEIERQMGDRTRPNRQERARQALRLLRLKDATRRRVRMNGWKVWVRAAALSLSPNPEIKSPTPPVKMEGQKKLQTLPQIVEKKKKSTIPRRHGSSIPGLRCQERLDRVADGGTLPKRNAPWIAGKGTSATGHRACSTDPIRGSTEGNLSRSRTQLQGKPRISNVVVLLAGVCWSHWGRQNATGEKWDNCEWFLHTTVLLR